MFHGYVSFPEGNIYLCDYIGACLNPGPQSEDNHNFTKGPLILLSTVAVFWQYPNNTVIH